MPRYAYRLGNQIYKVEYAEGHTIGTDCVSTTIVAKKIKLIERIR